MKPPTTLAPLWVGPRPVGIGMITPVVATPAPGGATPEVLDEAAVAVLGCLRALGRAATPIEMAARVQEPVVAVGVALHQLRTQGLVTLHRPSWLPARLAHWTSPEPHPRALVAVDLVLLIGADPAQPLDRALGQITQTGPLAVQTHLPGQMWVGISHPCPGHQVVVVAASGLEATDDRWQDLASAAGAAVIVGNPTVPARDPGELPAALAHATLPLVAMTTPTQGADPAPEVVRALWGLPDTTPVVVGDPRLAPDLHTAIHHLGKRA